MTSHNQKRKCHRRRKNPSNCRHTSHQVSPAFPLYAHAFLSLSVVGLPFFDGWKSINFKLPDTGRVTPHCQQPLRQHWRWHLPRGTENRPMEQQIPFWNSSFSGFMLVFGQVYTLASTQMVVVATYVRWLRIQGEVINLCICGSFPPFDPRALFKKWPEWLYMTWRLSSQSPTPNMLWSSVGNIMDGHENFQSAMT